MLSSLQLFADSQIFHGSFGAGLGCQHAEEAEGAPNTWALAPLETRETLETQTRQG